MQFFSWTTDYERYKRSLPKGKECIPYDKFLEDRWIQFQVKGEPAHRLFAEDSWNKLKRPHYNVHPNLVSRLCKVDMSKIPSNLIQMPHGFKTVHFRFAKEHKELAVSDSYETDNKDSENSAGFTPAGSFIHSILATRLERSMLFVSDFNILNDKNQPVYNMFAVECHDPKRSLQECIEDCIQKKRTQSYVDMVKNVLRLCVSIGFLSDNPTICESDVLSKDRIDFLHANEERKKIIVDRAVRRGKVGYNIGTDMMFLGERPLQSRRSRSESGKELEYAHFRTGHPHLVRYGEGKKLVKLRWYIPTTVRPDKPFKVD